eukprot:ANDGO_07101.mRNA.1 Calcium-binding protein NCSA
MGNQRSMMKKDELDQLVAASHFSREELQQLHKQFMDEAPTGIVSRKDFTGLASVMGIRDPFMVDLVFSSFDLNRDGAIEFTEVILAMSCMMRGSPDEKLEFAFNLYDIDHDGFVTRDEMLRIVTALYRMHGDLVSVQGEAFETPEQLVSKIFADMDMNEDGKLSLEEYKEGALRDPCVVQGLSLFR